MSNTYTLNRHWRFSLFGFAFLLLVFIGILVPVYISQRELVILALILAMIVLSGLLVFGAHTTRLATSPDGLLSCAFGKCTLIPWENFDKVEIHPVNSLIFATLKEPPKNIVALSPFFNNGSETDLLAEIVKYVPIDKIQQEIYDFHLEAQASKMKNA